MDLNKVREVRECFTQDEVNDLLGKTEEVWTLLQVMARPSGPLYIMGRTYGKRGKSDDEE